MTVVVTDRPAPGVRRLRLEGTDTLNALDETCKDQLLDELAACALDPDTRAVLLTGTGRAFCAGGDVRAMGRRTPLETEAVLAKGRQVVERLTAMPKPVVAAVNGLASGAGFNLALACDVVLAHEKAWFQQSFVRMGLVPDMGGTYFLARQVGVHRAKEIVLSGRRLDAAEAHGLGLVAQVHGDDLDKHAVAYTADLARGATAALGLTAGLLDRAVEGSLQQALDAEGHVQAVASSTQDHQRAVGAFLAKQPLEKVEFTGE